MNRKIIKWYQYKLISKIRKKVYLFLDHFLDTRSYHLNADIITGLIRRSDLNCSGLNQEVTDYLIDKYLDHRFDLLGSGWIKYDYKHRPAGMEGILFEDSITISEFDKNGDWLKTIVPSVHLSYSKKIWSLIEEGYQPIDWHRDHKSGYRWNSKIPYCKQPITPARGADIKMPWELSRMQHLVQLAVFTKTHPDKTEVCIKEFRNQVLDFIASNPVRMGVNWSCPMDVAIRITNILIAFDLFSQNDPQDILNQQFRDILACSVHDHAEHIFYHLERTYNFSNNHYLADLAGLIFCGIYLSGSRKTIKWMRFALKEFFSEIRIQFFEDGVNFEGSTSYHRLSGEITVHTLAIILGNVNSIHIPDDIIRRIFGMGLFTHNIRKPSGNVTQTGDNDSGRFLVLSPNGNFKGLSKSWEENSLNHDTFLSCVYGMFQNNELADFGKQFPLESSFIKSLMKDYPLSINPINFHISPKGSKSNVKSKYEDIYPYYNTLEISRTDDSDIGFNTNLLISAYPISGYFILKSDRCFIQISGLIPPEIPYLGHFHNDQLSVELQIDNFDIFLDPGTYVYTPLPEKRNVFRSGSMHSAPRIPGMEPNLILSGYGNLFDMKHHSKCSVVEITDSSVGIKLEFQDTTIIRRISVFNEMITIEDYSNMPFTINFYPFSEWSDGYGKIKPYIKPELPHIKFSENRSFQI